MKESVVVLGASDNPERYSNRAVKLLTAAGYKVIPVHPTLHSIEGIPVINGIEKVTGEVNTVTVYLSPKNSSPIIDSIIKLKPSRVILNPGTESPELEEALTKKGIRVQKACTLVLLNSGQF